MPEGLDNLLEVFDIMLACFILESGQINHDQPIHAIGKVRINIEIEEAYAVRLADFCVLFVQGRHRSAPDV